jgi:hypothetical protein
MSGYLAGGWSNLCAGVVEPAAALSGLLVVSVSINIQRIMESDGGNSPLRHRKSSRDHLLGERLREPVNVRTFPPWRSV